MPSSKTSPARSQGVPASMMASPKPRKSRRTRSVCSATSSTSLRLTAVIQDSLGISPFPDRMSVLNDDTDIQVPGRQSWWKRLGNNSRDVTEIMKERENEVIMNATNVGEEFDVEILSQEKENMSVDLPESSDHESIHSIVIPQRKLFTNQDNCPEKKLKVTANKKETLVKMQKSYFDHTNIDKDIDVMPKKLFNQVPKPKTKPVFTAALLNASVNKTVNINKIVEKPAQEVQGQVRDLFGYRRGTKRKNIYAEFLVSDSEDDIPEIQPRVFGFQKINDHQQASKQPRRSSQASVQSSVSNMSDVEINDWQHLPSSTMVEHQLEEPETPSKNSSLSWLSRPRNSDIVSIKNNSINKSKRSNSKIHPESTHPEIPESKEFNEINIRSQSLNRSIGKSKIVINNNKSLRETAKKNTSKHAHDVSKNKTLIKEDIHANLVNEEHEKRLTEVMRSDAVYDENFTLEYDDDYDKNGETSQNMTNKEKYDSVGSKKICKNSLKSNNSHVLVEITAKQSANVVIDINQNGNKLIEKSNHSQIKHNGTHDETINEVNKQNNKENEVNKSKQGQDEHKTNEISEENQQIGQQKVQGESRNDHELEQEEILQSHRDENISHQKIAQNNEEIEDVSDTAQKTSKNDADDEIMEEQQIASKELNYSDQNELDEEMEDVIDAQLAGMHETDQIVYEKVAGNLHVNNANYQKNTDSTEKSRNLTYDTTRRSKNKEILKSPEAVLHGKSNRGESFNTHGHHTSMSKSKTIIKDLSIRPSLAPARESTGLIDGTINSSAEGSGWDSHRTTRKTLRQTFGKDFTPRKSLRTLVMERAAKRPTTQNDQIADKSKHKSNFNERTDKSKDNSKILNSFNEDNNKSGVNTVANKSQHENSFSKVPNKSTLQTSLIENAKLFKRQTYFGDITNRRPIANSTELPDFDSYQEQDEESENEPKENEGVESNHPTEQNEVISDQKPEQNEEPESDQEVEQNSESESEQEIKSNQEPEQNEEVESNQEAEIHEEVESDQEPKQNEEVESNQEVEQHEEVESDQEPEQNEKVGLNQEVEQFEEVESDQESEQNEGVESNQEAEQHEEVESDQEPEQNEEVESNQEAEQYEEVESDQEAEQIEEVESDQEPEQNEEVESNQEAEQHEEVESVQEPEQSKDVESDQEAEQYLEAESNQELEQNEEFESDQEVEQTEEVESELEPEQNEESESDKDPGQSEEYESYRKPDSLEIDESDEESGHEASKQLRLKTLEMYLQKVRLENAERRHQMQEKVLNSLKVPTQSFNVFKMREVPKPKSTTNTVKKATTTKLKRTLFSKELPPEFLEDLKYKPPKRFQGKNAPWITKRLYKYLEDKLRAKYDYRARVRAEKLVETLYLFAKQVRKCARAAPPQLVSELKHEMARLDIVTTHYQFYQFFHEFMPREIRIRVNPDIMNKIPKPRNVFGNILEDYHNEV